MRLSHARRVISVRFDDSNLVSCVGLAAVLALAARCGLGGLVTDRVRIAAKGGVNAAAKIVALVAGMVAGADSISDMDLLRHGGMGRLFDEVRAPSTLGTFLRLFTFGHIRQLDAVAAGFLARLTAATPVLPGIGQVAFVDVDDTVRATYGYAKQGAWARLHRRERAQRAAGHVVHATVCTDDRSHPVAAGLGELGSRRGAAARRRPGLRTARWRHWAGDRARGLGVLQL
jgi:hypothetical protein